ncbi:MAG TPA: alpha/beta hydrolase [Puia sp.]|jgi:non-heme chloroperoxidase|nr:alpha/beta hydrolase [Puia sp.]
MNTLKVKDGTKIYFKDWGTGQPIVFHHGWPLSSDDWDAQMMFFLQHGYRVIAHDRRGHGRSTQTANGNDMDTYAADVAELVHHLDLKNAIHIGHSTGGGEVIRYVAKHGKGRVAKAVLISSVTPIMAQTAGNPQGIPIPILDEIRSKTATQRQQYFMDFTLPFFGYNRPNAKISESIRENWWRQGMMGGIKAQYDCIKAFSETDFTADLQQVDIPVLVLHGEDDQIVPFELTGARAVKLLKNGKLISYPGFPHGMPTTEAETINKDLLAFIDPNWKEKASTPAAKKAMA